MTVVVCLSWFVFCLFVFSVHIDLIKFYHVINKLPISDNIMVGHFICIFHFTEKQTRVSAGAVPRRTRSPRVQQRAGAGSRAAAPGGQAEALPLFPHRPGRELRGRPHATDTRGTGGPGRQSAPSPGPGAGSGPPRAAAGEGRDRQHARGCPAAGSTVAPDVAAALTAAPLTATAPTAAAPTAAPRLPLPPP